MRDTIEMSKSDFVRVLASAVSPCTELMYGTTDLPRGWIEPEPEACQHWLDGIAFMKVADAAIGRTLDQQRLGEALGEQGKDVLADNQSFVQRFADDFCGTPPIMPVPWPPPRRSLDPKGLTAMQLILVGARFQAAADHIGDNALQQEFAATADQLFAMGLSRLGGGD
jgi:hypothetical protein